MTVSQSDELTTGTLDGLELRLKRLESLLSGQAGGQAVEAPAGKDETVTARLERLEDALDKLSGTSRPIADLLRLYRAEPDLFPPTSAIPGPNSFNIHEQLAMVNSCAPSFSATASQLTSVQDSPIPPADDSAALIALQPGLAAAEQRQTLQGKQLADLRLRTAKVLQRWYDITVMGGNECWAEWDDRLMEAEKTVRKEEAKKESEKGPV